VAAEDMVQSTSGTKKTLLIVEDQRDIRLYLKILFDKEYNLLMATNGQEGVDMAIKELPDLIICDIMMPELDGYEVLETNKKPKTATTHLIL
jgi:CheY-like chemotaxis protein